MIFKSIYLKEFENFQFLMDLTQNVLQDIQKLLEYVLHIDIVIQKCILFYLPHFEITQPSPH